MLTFRNGAPGGVAQAEAYVAHLMELTLPADQMKLADYYARLDGTEATLAAGMGSIPRPQRDMAPEVAEALGIDPSRPLTREELGNILGGLRADGEQVAGSQREVRTYKGAEGSEGEAPGKQRERSAWMDLCLSAPKHLSVAWFRAETEGERQSLLQAHRDAVDETLAYIEREVAVATFGHGREASAEEPGRLGFIKVDHFTARPTLSITRPDPITGVSATELYSVMAAGDPQIHTHTIVPNVMVTESGRVLSIDTKRIAGRIHEFGAIYQGVLGAKLEALGVSTDLDPRTKMLRLTAIPEDVVQAFSKRTTQGEGAAEEYARQQGLVWGNMPTDQRVAMLKAALKERREGKGDDLANIASWNRQADAMGWKGRSVIAYGPPAPEQSLEQRTRDAGLAGLPHVEDMLHRSAVILGTDVRLAAARGWIATGGIRDTGHVSLATRAMVRNGVQQDGKWTELMFPRMERGRPERVRVTTGLHRDQEQELIALAKVAHAAPTGGVRPASRDAALTASPATLNAEQRVALDVLAGPGAMQVAIGGSGAGKTTLLAPLVAAYRAEGRDVWGTATANRQANALREAGIANSRTRALDPLLGMMRDRPEDFGPNSVVIVDELGQVGTRQLLRLMRQQRVLGFEVRLVGDDRQCQSIEAGPVIDLLRQAIGQAAIPEVLTTIRQQTERDRQIVGLWRAGKSVEALAMKREDGTAHLVPGGYAETVQAVAQQWRALVDANKHDPHYSISVTAPSNADALEVGKAIRAMRREGGQIAASDAITVQATDQVGNTFDLALAQGDRVRLFARTWGNFKGEDGRVRGSIVGDNGTVLTVHLIDVNPATGGLALRTGEGKVAFVPWERLRQEGSGRIALTYGDCLTIDTAQGITSDDTIMAMPGGSRAVTLYKAHVGGSRNRRTAHVFTAEAAEMVEVQQRRPINAPKMDDTALRDAVWGNVARNLARAPVKESALAMLRETEASARKARHVFAKGERKREAAEQGRGPASTACRRRVRRQQAEGAAPAIEQLGKTVGVQTAALRHLADQVEPNPGPALRAMEERLEAEARHLAPQVLMGGYGYGEAVDAMIRSELAQPGQHGAVHNLLAMEDTAGRVLADAIEAAEAGVVRSQQREQVMAKVDTIAAENAIMVVLGQQTTAQVRELVVRLAGRDAGGVTEAEIEAAAYVAVARETGRLQAQWNAARRSGGQGADAGTEPAKSGTRAAPGQSRGGTRAGAGPSRSAPRRTL